jgi:uncharacterized protein YeaO (DUF488 family)
MANPSLYPLRLKRVYDPPSPDDGFRVLVERLWPRGITKQAASLTQWLKAAAPSPDLRKWYAHDVTKWEAFQERYRADLAHRPAELERLRTLRREGPLTLVFASRDEARCSATVLKAVLEEEA